jgi:UDP-3-O-[3-hydroxymyristoyl] glucosamine N-acyltransferase
LITGREIQSQHSDVFTFLDGNLESLANCCVIPERACSDSLVFISDADQMAQACILAPAIYVIHAKAARTLVYDRLPRSCYFTVKNVPMGMSVLLKYFDHKTARFAQWGTRHATAVVHPDARIGADVLLGPYCVIGAGATIGAGCKIGAHSVIENGATLGAGTMIHPHVFIGANCEIGIECEIHPHSTIGSDGFGYAIGADGRPRKIPHLGNVVIGDQVEIGSSCSVDRATLTSTHIRSGTKLDNLCHIAHNCDLGENGLYTAGFMMGGSTKIGRSFSTGGNSVVTTHVTLGDNVALAGRSTVTHDIPAAGAYGGYPLQPIGESLKTTVSIGRLNEIRKNLNRVMKHLKLD